MTWITVLGAFSNSVKIFRLQKKIIRIMLGCRSRDSCRTLFKKLKILPLPSQYILSLLSVIRNKKQYTYNSEVCHTDMRQHLHLHQPLPNLAKYQPGVYCLGIKAFNVLPSYIKQVSKSPKKFLYENSFYSLEKYFQVHNIWT
jgi:hypothetical protein